MKRLRSKVPVISLDYMWMKGRKGDGEGEPEGNPILVMRCRNTKVTWSRVVLRKGVDPYSIKVLSVVPLHHELVSTGDEVQAVDMSELFGDILAKRVASAPW